MYSIKTFPRPPWAYLNGKRLNIPPKENKIFFLRFLQEMWKMLFFCLKRIFTRIRASRQFIFSSFLLLLRLISSFILRFALKCFPSHKYISSLLVKSIFFFLSLSFAVQKECHVFSSNITLKPFYKPHVLLKVVMGVLIPYICVTSKENLIGIFRTSFCGEKVE